MQRVLAKLTGDTHTIGARERQDPILECKKENMLKIQYLPMYYE